MSGTYRFQWSENELIGMNAEQLEVLNREYPVATLADFKAHAARDPHRVRRLSWVKNSPTFELVLEASARFAGFFDMTNCRLDAAVSGVGGHHEPLVYVEGLQGQYDARWRLLEFAARGVTFYVLASEVA